MMSWPRRCVCNHANCDDLSAGDPERDNRNETPARCHQDCWAPIRPAEEQQVSGFESLASSLTGATRRHAVAPVPGAVAPPRTCGLAGITGPVVGNRRRRDSASAKPAAARSPAGSVAV